MSNGLNSSKIKYKFLSNYEDDENSYGKKDVWKLLLQVSLPALMMLTFNAMNDVTDALIAAYMIPNNVDLVLSTGLSSDVVTQSVVSASAYDSNLMYIAIAIITTVSIGSEIKYSRLLSMGKVDEAKQLIGTSITSTFIISFITFVALFGLTEELVTMLNGGSHSAADELTIKMASDYIRIELTWIFFFAMTDLLVKFLRIEGKSLTVSLIASLTLPINILFDLIFLGPVGISLYGCGLGSLFGEIVSFLTLLIYIIYLRNKRETNILSNNIEYKPSKNVLFATLIIAAPIFFSSIIQSVNSFAITSFATSLTAPTSVTSTTSIADNQFFSTSIAIFTEINAMMFLVIAGVSQAFCSIIAYNYTQKKYDRVKKITLYSLLYMVIFMLIFQLIFQLLMPQLFWLWSIGDWPSEGINFSRVLTAKTFLLGISYIFMSYYIAIDKRKNAYFNLFTSSVIVFYIVVPVSFALLKDSSTGYLIWASSPTISELISIVILSPIFFVNLRNAKNQKQKFNILESNLISKFRIK